MRVQISGHTAGVGNGYRSSTAYVSYEGSSAASSASSEITLGSCPAIRINRSGWVATFQFNPNQANAAAFSGTAYVEIYFARGEAQNGNNIEWSVT